MKHSERNQERLTQSLQMLAEIESASKTSPRVETVVMARWDADHDPSRLTRSRNRRVIRMATLAAGITIVGAGWGFGRIGAAALESMARQPEIAGRIQTAMIVIAALLEGATFFALLICIQVGGKLATDLRF